MGAVFILLSMFLIAYAIHKIEIKLDRPRMGQYVLIDKVTEAVLVEKVSDKVYKVSLLTNEIIEVEYERIMF